MYCDKCGNEIKSGEKFCSQCGTEIKSKESVEIENNLERDKVKNGKVIVGYIALVLFIGFSIFTIMYFNTSEKKIIGEWYEINRDTPSNSSIVFYEDGTFNGFGEQGTYQFMNDKLVFRYKWVVSQFEHEYTYEFNEKVLVLKDKNGNILEFSKIKPQGIPRKNTTEKEKYDKVTNSSNGEEVVENQNSQNSETEEKKDDEILKEQDNDEKITFVKGVDGGLNVRSQPRHKSDLIKTVKSSTEKLYYSGESAEGYGSDGELHVWYKIDIETGGTGWVRSDLVILAE